MFYREAGLFKTNYASDQAIFPIPQDLWTVVAVVFLTLWYGRRKRDRVRKALLDEGWVIPEGDDTPSS